MENMILFLDNWFVVMQVSSQSSVLCSNEISILELLIATLSVIIYQPKGSVAIWGLQQAGQRIPSYFSSNGNCHYKTYEIQRNQTWKVGEGAFTIPVDEVHLKYQFTNSGARNCGITDFGQNKMATRKRSLSSQVRLNLGNLRYLALHNMRKSERKLPWCAAHS